MPSTSPRHALAGAVVCFLVLAGCAVGEAEPGESDGPAGELIVFATASLTDAFSELAGAFVAAHPDVDVVLNLAGSQTLASQIVLGAPADVFASANPVQMEVVADAGHLAADPQVLATNTLAIAVEPGNPFGVTGLADLGDPALVVVLPAPEVPAGAYALEALDRAGITVTPSSLEQDVRAALGRVALGEADATIVYASDLVGARSGVEGVAIPATDNVTATYAIAVLADGPNPTAAEAFVAYALGTEGQAILAGHGFAGR